jgi:hypothetical protein
VIRAKHILEEYLTLFTRSQFSTPLFLNPSRSELRELGDAIRFIADSSQKKLYAGDANVVVHPDITKVLNLKSGGPTQLWGYARRRGNQYVLTGSDSLRHKIDLRDLYGDYVEEFFGYDWAWVNKYVNINPYFEFVKNFMETTQIRHSNLPREIPL